MRFLNLVCSGVVVMMAVVTTMMLWRLELIRKTSRLHSKQAAVLALIAGGGWLVAFFLLNFDWQSRQFLPTLGVIPALLLVLPYLAFIRWWICRRLDRVGHTIAPRITDLQPLAIGGKDGYWQAHYEYLGEYRGKQRVQPEMQKFAADYQHADETAQEAEGAVAAALPTAAIRYLERHPNVHRFEYTAPASADKLYPIQLSLHEKGFFKLNWKRVLLVVGFTFVATVVLMVVDVWNDRNDLQVAAEAGWMQTDVSLKKGQCIHFEPSGSVRISDREGYRGDLSPEGWPLPCTANEAGACLLENAPYGALIARFRDGEPFVVDRNMAVTVPQNGALWLAVNDHLNSLDDNSGSFRVKYWVVNQPCD